MDEEKYREGQEALGASAVLSLLKLLFSSFADLSQSPVPEYKCFWCTQMCNKVPWTWSKHYRNTFFTISQETLDKKSFYIIALGSMTVCNISARVTAVHFIIFFPFSVSLI